MRVERVFGPDNDGSIQENTTMVKRTKKAVEAAQVEGNEAVETEATDAPVEAATEAPAKEKKTKAKSTTKKGKTVETMTEVKTKKGKTVKGEKVETKPKPKKERKSSGLPRNVQVNGEDWPRKKAAVLYALQVLKTEVTKKDILAVLEKEFAMNEDKVNKFCYALTEEGFAEVNYYEGDLNHYRTVTKKGLKVKLPALN